MRPSQIIGGGLNLGAEQERATGESGMRVHWSWLTRGTSYLGSGTSTPAAYWGLGVKSRVAGCADEAERELGKRH